MGHYPSGQSLDITNESINCLKSIFQTKMINSKTLFGRTKERLVHLHLLAASLAYEKRSCKWLDSKSNKAEAVVINKCFKIQYFFFLKISLYKIKN